MNGSSRTLHLIATAALLSAPGIGVRDAFALTKPMGVLLPAEKSSPLFSGLTAADFGIYRHGPAGINRPSVIDGVKDIETRAAISAAASAAAAKNAPRAPRTFSAKASLKDIAGKVAPRGGKAAASDDYARATQSWDKKGPKKGSYMIQADDTFIWVAANSKGPSSKVPLGPARKGARAGNKKTVSSWIKRNFLYNTAKASRNRNMAILSGLTVGIALINFLFLY